MRVLLIAGGWSSEREVALSGAKGIAKALEQLGHEVTQFDPAKEFDTLLDLAIESDFAFLSLHGQPGEDGLIQAILDQAGCPYQGAGPAGSFLALNKVTAKCFFKQLNLPTAPWVFAPAPATPDAPCFWDFNLDLPAYVKANTGGSSLDMGLARTRDELDAIVEQLHAKGLDVLIEQGLEGPELTCAVLGDQALPPILIKPLASDAFFDYESKYQQGGAEEVCPAPVSQNIIQTLQKRALAAHKALGLRGYSRADFILSGDELYLLEVNTLPGMTPTSLLPKAAAAAGYSYEQLVAKLIELGIEGA